MLSPHSLGLQDSLAHPDVIALIVSRHRSTIEQDRQPSLERVLRIFCLEFSRTYQTIDFHDWYLFLPYLLPILPRNTFLPNLVSLFHITISSNKLLYIFPNLALSSLALDKSTREFQ